MKDAGYETGAFGKIAPLTDPLLQGFDTFIGQVDQSACHQMYPRALDSGKRPSTISHDGWYNVNLTGNIENVPSREACMQNVSIFNYTVDVFLDSALSWLQSQRADSPFFMYLSFTVPHAGGWGVEKDYSETGAPVPSDGIYSNETSWPDVEKDHAAVVTYLDNSIGKLFDVLRQMKIDDESTLIFFASDNGAHNEGSHDVTFFNSTGGLRGFKRSLYEGGVRSPTMVRWKNVVPENRVSSYPWAFWDVYSTLSDLTGSSNGDSTDGLSILRALKGDERDEDKHPYFYFTWGSGETSGYSVRLGRESFKGVVHRCGSTGRPHSNDDGASAICLSIRSRRMI